MFRPVVTAALCLLWLCASSANAGNWPIWRGPSGDGVSTEKHLPVHWSTTENVAWKVPVPYGGHASPIIWGETIYLVGADRERERRMLVAIDRRNGKVRWEREVVQTPLERKHRLNSWASSTPATDGKVIYVSFLDREAMFVAAYDLAGTLLWRERPGVFSSRHGYCSSPVLYKDKVIVNGDHDGDAYIVALDRRTGKALWKTDRENKTRSYCTPIIRTFGGRTQLILSGSKSIASFDPDTGKRHWVIDGPTDQFVASPVVNKGLVFVTGGFPDKHILAIDPAGKGNITDSKLIKWRHRKGVSYVPSPIAAGDYFYCVSDNGIGTCFDANTGDVKWQQRMGKRYSASLIAAENHVYFLDDFGNCKVLEVGDEYEELAENKLGEATYASPAISDGQLIIRGEKHLFCIGRRRTAIVDTK